MRIALLIALTLIAALAVAGAAGAAALTPSPIPPPLFVALDEEAEEEAEIEAEELEVCEEEEPGECEEEEVTETDPAAKCALRSANAHVATKNGKLKLTIGYTTSEPVTATIEIRKGATRIGTFKRHLGKSGTIRLAKQLSDSQMAKLDASDRLDVRLRAIGAPSNCKRVGNLSPRLVLLSREH